MSPAHGLFLAADWPRYLGSIRGDGVSLPVSRRALELVAGRDDLIREYQTCFSPADDRLVFSRKRLQQVITRRTDDNQQDFHDLGAEFVHQLAPFLNELRIQSGAMLRVADSLSSVDETVGMPADIGIRRRWLEAREFFIEGCAKSAEMLFPEALEWFTKAQESFPTDFSIQFQLGWTYLYGASGSETVIDLEKAEEHLRRAVRYGKGAVRRVQSMTSTTAETVLHLSVVVFLKAAALRRSGQAQAASERFAEAANLIDDALSVNPKLAQAHYHRAKYLTALGREPAAVGSFEQALRLDRGFALLGESDADLEPVRPLLLALIEQLRAEAKVKADEALARTQESETIKTQEAALENRLAELRSSLAGTSGTDEPGTADYAFFPGQKSEARIHYETEIRNVERSLAKLDKLCARIDAALTEAEALTGRARDIYAGGTLFAFQDVVPLAVDAVVPLKRTHGFLADAGLAEEACAARIPTLASLRARVAEERIANAKAFRRWKVLDALRRSAGKLFRYALTGLVFGMLVRVIIHFATQGFDVGLDVVVGRSVGFGLVGALVGIGIGVAEAFRKPKT